MLDSEKCIDCPHDWDCDGPCILEDTDDYIDDSLNSGEMIKK